MFPNNKLKAITFSFDDGVTQDEKLIEILNRYQLKCTFNLNSELLGLEGTLTRNDKKVNFNKINPVDVNKTYQGHEVAVHTRTHPNLCSLDSEEIIDQVEKDRIRLSELCGYEVIGMAYPCGGVNNDDRVAQIIRDHTGVQYSRTITETGNFDLQSNLYRFNPSVYLIHSDDMVELGKQFINLQTETPKIFYVWGHSFEFDAYDLWEKFEDFCNIISGKDDIFYGTNKEVLLAR